MTIRYVAYTWQGHKVEGVLAVETVQAARELLQRDQFIPYRLAPVRPRLSLVRLFPSLFRPPPKEIIDFTRSLSTLLASGIPIGRALKALRDQSRSLGFKEALGRVLRDIEGGDRFSVACSRHPTVFPPFYMRLLTVGEATGKLPPTLDQLAQNLEKGKALRDRVRGALMYPAISIVVAAIAAFILVTYSLPALTGLLKEFGGELPFATRLLVAISDTLRAYRVFILASALGVPAVVFSLMRTRRGAKVRDRLLLRMPVAGKVLLSSNLASLTSTLGTLLRAGVPPIEALHLSQESVTNLVVRDSLARVTEEASTGARLGQAFEREGLFPPILVQGIITGEMTGSLPETLRSLSGYYELETTKSVGAATELIQPAIILVVAAVVGFVAVAVISGIYSTLGSIK